MLALELPFGRDRQHEKTCTMADCKFVSRVGIQVGTMYSPKSEASLSVAVSPQVPLTSQRFATGNALFGMSDEGFHCGSCYSQSINRWRDKNNRGARYGKSYIQSIVSTLT